MQQEQERLEQQLLDLQQQLASFPEGKLISGKNGKYRKWYCSNGSHPSYIPKKKRKLAETLAVKKYYEKQVDEISYTLTLIQRFLKSYHKYSFQSASMLENDSDYQQLLSSYFLSPSQKAREWCNENFTQNENHKERLIHKTLAGHLVRSKSEVLIANALLQNKVPYRYECELNLDGIQLYPDFTILHPSTQKIIYWEHFGLMDHPGYQEQAFHKLKTYTTNHIYPSIHLITTFETKDYPINSQKIQTIIQEYFLAM